MATAPVGVRGTFAGWRGVTAMGCALAIGIAVAVNISAGAPITPLLGVAAVFACAGVLIGARPGRLGAAIALIAAGVFLLPTVLAFPESFAWSNDPVEFTIAAAGVVALALVLFGGVTTLIRGNGTLIAPDTNAPRGLVIMGFLLVSLALVTSLALRMTVSDATASPGDVVVAVSAFQFPETVTAPSGTFLVVSNADRGAHTFTVDELNLDLVVPGRSSARVALKAEPGSYAVRCRIPGHGFMSSALLVQ